MKDLLRATADRAARYRASLQERSVAPAPEALANLARLDEPFPEHATDAAKVIALLDEIGSPATIASAGGRVFRFVVRGAPPANRPARTPPGPRGHKARVRAPSPPSARPWKGAQCPA